MMEGGAGVSPLSMDCEDMFKEITKKLYGEEAASGVEFPAAERHEERPEESLTAWGLAALVRGGVPPPGILQANFAPRTEPGAEDRWTAADEPLAWAQSRVAAYNPAQRLFKCCDCECVGFLARVAEHWLGTHSHARCFHCPAAQCGFASGWARAVRAHLARDHHADPAAADQLLRDNPALDDLTRYLARLKAKVEARRTPPVVVPEPVPEPPAPPAPPTDAAKRYACAACPYATDRRDLFTRHENIHRDEKPFHCYLCQKQFNRADHVKKHFLRMHRDQPYDLSRIKRAPVETVVPPPIPVPAPAPPPAQHYYKPEPVRGKTAPVGAPVGTAPVQGGAAAAAAARRRGERRYACCYCPWAGADNWCLKRHLNTHLKPFACALCEYKAARAERLATHVRRVHGKLACARCAFLADDQPRLAEHLRLAHHIESRSLKVPSTSVSSRACATAGVSAVGGADANSVTDGGAVANAGVNAARRGRAAGAARLFGYLEASDGSGDEFEALPEFAPAPPFTRDKENAAPPIDHCLRY